MRSDLFAQAMFRANPQFELVPFDRLSPRERLAANEAMDGPPTYGVIRPKILSVGPARCVCADVALLFLTLREAGRLPDYFASAFGSACRETLAGLVAGGIIEIDIDGVYTGGPRGLAAVLGPTVVPSAWNTDARSAAAMRCALARQTDDVRALAAHLYAHHRIPANGHWRAQLRGPADIERFLGIDEHCAIALRSSAGWYCWSSRPAALTCRYKLYVSPQPGALRETVAAVIGATRHGARALKIGSDIYGLLRPDKIAIYFATFESLAEAARALNRELADVPAHGVPFTATIGTSGLLAWGIDGLARDIQTGTLSSWRQWVTLRVAEALTIVKRQSPLDDDSVWPFVHRRLELAGVDARTWSPLDTRRRGTLVPAI